RKYYSAATAPHLTFPHPFPANPSLSAVHGGDLKPPPPCSLRSTSVSDFHLASRCLVIGCQLPGY
ncbi:hypothetical protein MTR67_036923, partial [Solanum verrucosum]